MNKHARELGKLGRGKPKSFTRAERLRRRQRMKNLHALMRKKKSL